ncbi:DUF899 family protein [Amycolatopsis jejuensis]|uniref:DUF899 family protein n=1 Tax=Amycolatopsis jejuensis TaxID=330084 RepID=UPI000AEB2189
MRYPGDEAGYPGCSLLVDSMGHPAHLHARDVTLTVVAPAKTSSAPASRPAAVAASSCRTCAAAAAATRRAAGGGGTTNTGKSTEKLSPAVSGRP